MNARAIIGIALASVGVLLIAGLVPMATISYIDDGSSLIDYTSPAGTAQAPTVCAPGANVLVAMRVLAYDRLSGLSLPNYADASGWIANVSISPNVPGAQKQVIDFGEYDKREALPSSVGDMKVWYVWEQSWTAPTAQGLLTFTFTLDLGTTEGSSIETIRKVAYASVVAVEEPDGYFTVNGAKADASSMIAVNSPDLTFGFVPTKNASGIHDVTVDVFKDANLGEWPVKVGTVILAKKTDGTYDGTYTLPGLGLYVIKGYIKTEQGSPLLKLTTVVGTDTDDDGTVEEDDEATRPLFDKWQLFGMLILVSGMAIAYSGRSRRR